MGVVEAFCRRCRCALEKSDKGRTLPDCACCGNKEKRKTAEDYGNVFRALKASVPHLERWEVNLKRHNEPRNPDFQTSKEK